MEISEQIRDVVATGPLAHLTTLNPDRSPQVSVIWVGIEDDEFVLAHMPEQQKLCNMRRDDRVALSFLAPTVNALGLHEYVVIYGTTRITEGGAADLLQRLAHVYLGPDAVFPPEQLRHLPGHITRIRPERISGMGRWTRS